MKFHIIGTKEVLVSHSGLALAGTLLQGTKIRQRLNRRKREGSPPVIADADNLLAMIGLLCMGKSDFEAVRAFEDESNEFFRLALGLKRVPSEATLRQRLDRLGAEDAAADESEPPVRTILLEESAEMVRRHAPKLTPCWKDWIALDGDVATNDNRKCQKEGVGDTDKGIQGYDTKREDFGQQGDFSNKLRRKGTLHRQAGATAVREETFRLARTSTDGRLRGRLHAGFDDLANVRGGRQKVHGPGDSISNRNRRKVSLTEGFEEASAHGEPVAGRAGKEIWFGDAWRERDYRLERVGVQAIRREATADGQALRVPDLEIQTFWTSRKPSEGSASQGVALFHDHGTSEQFLSECKTDMNLERVPSGKFATNALVLECGQVAYNVLRLCGQESPRQDRALPPEEKMPVRRTVRRRRLRSVIQDMVYLACRLTRHAGRWRLAFWKNNPWRPVWQRVYERFLAPGRSGLLPASVPR